METARSLLLCADMDNLAFSMETHDLWARLLGASMWQNGLHSLANYGPNPFHALPHAAPHTALHGAPSAALLK